MRDLAMSKDPKERIIGNGILGRKGDKALSGIELEPLIQGYIAYQDSIPENQQLIKFSTDINKDFDIFTNRLIPTTIPDYSDAGGVAEGSEAVGPPIPTPTQEVIPTEIKEEPIPPNATQSEINAILRRNRDAKRKVGIEKLTRNIGRVQIPSY